MPKPASRSKRTPSTTWANSLDRPQQPDLTAKRKSFCTGALSFCRRARAGGICPMQDILPAQGVFANRYAVAIAALGPLPARRSRQHKSGPRPRRDPLPTRKTSASAWLSEPSPAAACSFNACLLLDQLAVVHLVGGAVDDDVPAVRHAGVRSVQVALRAVELAGLVGLMAVSAGHNAVLALVMRVELAIGRGGGQVVDGVDAVMAAALQAEDGRMRKRSRRIAKAVLVMPPDACRSVSHAPHCDGSQCPVTSLHCSPARPAKPAARLLSVNVKKVMQDNSHHLLTGNLPHICASKVALWCPLVTHAGYLSTRNRPRSIPRSSAFSQSS